MEKLGLLGGTFDPPHLGHKLVADTARRELGLERVLFVPAARPYHKEGPTADFDQRVEMVEVMCAAEPAYEICDFERGREKPSYTVDLLRHFRDRGYARDRLFFLMGADSLRDLHGWKECRRLFELGTLVAVTRPGYSLESAELAPDLLAQVVRLDVEGRKISSTRLRALLREGAEDGELDAIPEAVLELARRHYRPGEEGAEDAAVEG